MTVSWIFGDDCPAGASGAGVVVLDWAWRDSSFARDEGPLVLLPDPQSVITPKPAGFLRFGKLPACVSTGWVDCASSAQ